MLCLLPGFRRTSKPPSWGELSHEAQRANAEAVWHLSVVWHGMICLRLTPGSRAGEDVVMTHSLTSCFLNVHAPWDKMPASTSQYAKPGDSNSYLCGCVSILSHSTLQSTAGLPRGCRTSILEEVPLKSLLRCQCSEEPCLIRGVC